MKLFFLIYLSFFTSLCFAQDSIKDTVSIKEIEILDVNRSLNTINKITSDSSAIFSSQDVLQKQSIIYIRSGGIGLSGGVSVRGLSPHHTPILWNHVMIQSPALGMGDVSLYSPLLGNSIELNTSGTLHPSSYGNFGGTLSYSNEVAEGISFQQSLSSMKNITSLFSFSKKLKKLSVASRFLYSNAKNEFVFKDDRNTAPIFTSIANNLVQSGISQDLNYTINTNSTLSLNALYQNTQREIPPFLYSINANENQTDINFWVNAKYSLYKANRTFSTNIAYLDDRLNYTNGLANIDSRLHSKTMVLNTQQMFYYKSFRFQTGMNEQFNTVSNSGYSIAINQNVFSPFVSFTKIFNKGEIALNYRPLLRDNDIYYKALSAIGNYSITKFYNMNIEFSNNNRIPTLNDLYWNPGGNPFLKPEESASANLGQKIYFTRNSKSFELKANAFYNHVTNWILWQPGIYGYWSPQNLREVTIKGYDVNVRVNSKWKEGNLMFNLSCQYNEALQTKVYDLKSNVFGKQLIYVPIYTLKSTLAYQFKKLSLGGDGQLYSWRPTSSDNYEYLPAYYIVNANIAYNLSFKKHAIALRFDVNNILDKSYMLIKSRPMPGRNYTLTLSYVLR